MPTVVVKLKYSDVPNRIPGKGEKVEPLDQLVIRDGDSITGEIPLSKVDYWFNEP